MLTAQTFRGSLDALYKHNQPPKVVAQIHSHRAGLACAPSYKRSYASAADDKREKVVILGSGWAGWWFLYFALNAY